ncbi:extracellular solute-binding protein [Paenibacillus harenae]|uniref:extracellular solute-binding protein n=1 Tax=Paenibacillus harenae TaxID=306543 RepID=UPI0003FDBC04|nr:extracellular solute-binding protein [Paenibacillus harenae]
MTNSKKSWTGLMALALSVSLVTAGCSGAGNTRAYDSNLSNGAESSSQDAPIEITWANNFNTPEKDGNYVQTELEKKFNVKINNVHLERVTWKEQITVLLASGDIPDIFPIDATETDMVLWADQGIIASIDPAEIKAHMPKFTAALNSVDSGAWSVGQYNGKNWGIPKVWPGGLDGFMPGYNEAWLKNIGYSEPPKTLEELEDVLTKFVNDDPDKNGRKDTFGLTGRGKLTEQLFTSIFSAHGISPYQFKMGAEGKIVYGGITEETRMALKLLNKWYKSGLIDPEFITTDNNEINNKFAGRKVGMVDNMKWVNFHKDSSFVTKPGLEKGEVIQPASPFPAPDGEPYGFAYGARQAPVLLGKQLEEDEKKRHKMMEILEYVSTDSEGYLLTGFGQLGVSYEMEGDLAIAKTEEEFAAWKFGAGHFYNPLSSIDVTMQKHTTKPDVLELKEKLSPLVTPLFDILGPAVLTSKPKYWGNLKTLQDTYLIKAIAGEADTDKDFDSFKEYWLRFGGREVTDEVNKVFAERKE